VRPAGARVSRTGAQGSLVPASTPSTVIANVMIVLARVETLCMLGPLAPVGARLSPLASAADRHQPSGAACLRLLTVDRGQGQGQIITFRGLALSSAPSLSLSACAAQRRVRRDYLFCRETMAKVAVADLLVDAELCRVVEEELAPAAHVDPAAFWSATSALIHEYAPRNQVRARPRHRSPPPFPA
jgi:hypothetical protein